MYVIMLCYEVSSVQPTLTGQAKHRPYVEQGIINPRYYIHNLVQYATDSSYTQRIKQRCAYATNILYTQRRQMATLDAPKLLVLTNKTKLTLTVALALTDTVTVTFLRAFRRHR